MMEEEKRLLNSENEDSIALNVNNNINDNILLLNNIKSNYNLRLVFSYLKYNYILKLIKKNKSLQNQLGIDKQNYKDYSDIKYISVVKKETKGGYIVDNGLASPLCQLLYLLYLFLIIIIFYTIYVNITQRKLNISFVNKVNYSLFALIILSFIFSSFLKKDIHIYLVLLFIFINIFYDILIAVKMYIISEIFGADLFYLIINLIYITFNFIYSVNSWPETKKIIDNKLLSYKNIQIKPYYIKNLKDFENNNKKYISNIVNYLEYNYLIGDLRIISKINDFREKNNLTKLKEKCNLPDFIINERSEVILFNSKHIFKLSNNEYLLKYEIGKFNFYFKNDNEGLINILLKEDLNAINIITQRNMQYILLYYQY